METFFSRFTLHFLPPAGNRKALCRAQKSTGTEFFIPYTGAREKQVVFSPPAFFPLCTKQGKRGILLPANARLLPLCMELALRMQGAGCLTTLSLLCTFLCALQFLL